MSVDVFLLINLLALFHRTTALPARIPSPGRAPRPSCVIPIPRLPKPHLCFPTDPDSSCLPTSVLTVPLGLLYSAVVPKGAFSIRDQHKPPNPLVFTLGSNWRGAQARWFNVHGQFSSVLTGTAPLGLIYSAVVPKGAFSIRDQYKPPTPLVSTLSSNWRGAQARWLNVHGQFISSVLTGAAPLGLIYSAVVPKGAFSIRDQHKPPKPLVSTLGSNWRGAQSRWLNANQQAEASCQAPILSTVLHSNVSPGVHPHRDQPSCQKPRLDKMVSAGAPHWRGAQAQWLDKRRGSSGCRLVLLRLIAPLMFLLVSILTETSPLVTNPVSTRWSPPVVISCVVLMISGSLSALTQSLL